MPQISSLIRDIQAQLKLKGWVTPEISAELGREVAIRFEQQFNREHQASLRLSGMGLKCPCALWYSVHHPELAEELPPWAEFKYSFGHVIEAQAILLAKASGHEVTGEQDELVVDGVRGHRDCVIDGCIVDVKSASSISFNKFKSGAIAQSDDFGYLDQLDGYLVGSLDDPLVRTEDRAYILAIDKQLGHMCLYEHYIREKSIRERIATYKSIVARDKAPACTCGEVDDGKSGNVKLSTTAGYNRFKYCCKPHIRTFLYAEGPRYLTKVVRRPVRQDGTPIPEVDRHGNFIHHFH